MVGVGLWQAPWLRDWGMQAKARSLDYSCFDTVVTEENVEEIEEAEREREARARARARARGSYARVAGQGLCRVWLC